jgi:hypothetical protein
MTHWSLSRICVSSVTMICMMSSVTTAQPVQVNAGQVLTEADLTAGTFLGQTFSLATGAAFQINSGGRVAPTGTASNPFSWNQAGVEVMQGGVFEGDVNTVPGVRDINITVQSGGLIGDGANFFDSNITIEHGGEIGRGVWVNALAPMTINMNGGTIGDGFIASGATEFVAFNLLGGTVRDNFNGYGSGVLSASGGVMEGGYTEGWSIGLSGSARLNSFSVTRGDLLLNGAATFNGNGLVSESNFQMLGGSFATDNSGAILYDCVGQITGGVVGDSVRMFNRADQIPFGISGGQVGNDLELNGGALTITGGVVGDDLEVSSRGLLQNFVPGTLLITGGQVGERLSVVGGSSATIRGGTIGDGLRAALGGFIMIEEGEFGTVSAFSQGTIRIEGGEFGIIAASPQGTIQLFVTSALLDGATLPLVPGVAYTVPNRSGELLTATLLDGSLFDLSLFAQPLPGRDLIAADATLTITLIPSPATLGVALALVGIAPVRRRRRCRS